MDGDFLLVIGLVIAALGFPALVNAFSGGRSVLTAIGLMAVGAAFVVAAVVTKPGGYRFEDVPQAFVRVVAQIIN